MAKVESVLMSCSAIVLLSASQSASETVELLFPHSFGFVGRPPFVWLKTWAYTEHWSADMRELNSLQMLNDLPMSSFAACSVKLMELWSVLISSNACNKAYIMFLNVWMLCQIRYQFDEKQKVLWHVLHNIITRSTKALSDFLPQSLHKALSLCKCSSSEWSVPFILALYHIIHKPNLDSHSCGRNTHKCQRNKNKKSIT